MNNSELIRAVSKDTGFTIKDVTPVIKSVFDTIADTVVSGEKVSITGFGVFKTTTRKAHTGVNPRTGEQMEIGESRNMKFTPSNIIKNTYRG